MSYVAAPKPTRLTVTSQLDSQNNYDVTEYEEKEDGYAVRITQFHDYIVPLGLSPAAYKRYAKRSHELGMMQNCPPAESDYFGPSELKQRINSIIVPQNSAYICCKYCSGPHLTQSCPVKQILSKEVRKQTKMYLCKFEPIPIGYGARDMQQFIETNFEKLRPKLDELNAASAKRQLGPEEQKRRLYLANVLRGLPAKVSTREDRFIYGKRPGQRIDTGISGYEICFATFRTREAADFAEKNFQRIELIGQNTFMYCMFLREVDG